MRKILITLMLISFGFMTPNANSFIFSSKKKNEDVHINEIWSKFNSGPHYELNKIVYLDEIVKSVLDENISFIYNPGGTVAYQILDSNVIEQYQNATNLLSSKGIKNTLIDIEKYFVIPGQGSLFPIDSNAHLYYANKEKFYLALGTNLVPLIPLFESHLAEGKNYPEAVYALIHTREEGIPSLLKTQESDFAPLRELGLTGLTTLAQYTYLENPPPKEITEEVLPYFKQYLSNPSSNRLLIDDPNRLSFEIYLDTVRCMAIEGLFFYSRSPEDCREMILQQAIQAENPAVRYYAVMRLWYLQVRFGSMDSKTKEALQQIANNPEEEFFIRALAYNGLSCPLNRDDCENSERSLYLFYLANNELCRGLMGSIPTFQTPLLPLRATAVPTWGLYGGE